MSHFTVVARWICATAVAQLLVGCGGNSTLHRQNAEPAAPENEPPGSAALESPGAPVQTESSDPFRLAWEDDFNVLDLTRWQLMTHSWDSNLAQFSTENARVADGILQLALTSSPNDAVKPFRGVELRSRQTLTYGKVEARLRFARGSGVVSALVLIYTPWPADDWNELDIEFLGRYSDRVQFNTMVYTGMPLTLPVTQSVTPTQYPQLVTLPFDAAADFHLFAIEWTPQGATFSVDGVPQHTWDTERERLKLPQNILLTIWASSSPQWAGAIEPDAAPVTADYDWIRVYDYAP
jgi:endo-1,3-1,4-beta-glycanase ExoK